MKNKRKENVTKHNSQNLRYFQKVYKLKLYILFSKSNQV
jgi:hypothetical protein